MFRIRLLIAVPFLCYFLAAHGWPSQNLSASTTQMLAQLRDNLTSDFSPDEAVVSETSQITLSAVKIHGASILGDAELEASVAQFVGVAMTYEQMFEITMTVESYYRQHNYLARVMLPTQDLSSGVLHLEVMESVVTLTEVDQKLEELPNTRAHVDALVATQKEEHASHPSGEDADVMVLLSMYQSRTSNADTQVDVVQYSSHIEPGEFSLISSLGDRVEQDYAWVSREYLRTGSSMWNESWIRRRRQTSAAVTQTVVY